MARYNLSTGRMVDSFATNDEVSDKAVQSNGSGRFVLGNAIYTVYPSSDYWAGYRFEILRSTDDTFAGMKRIATVPEGTMGKVNSTTTSTPISVVTDPDGTARVYVYAAGNGISAYRISDSSAGIHTIRPASDISVSVHGRDIILSRPAAQTDVYTPTGTLVSSLRGVDRVHVPAPGIYIVVTEGKVSRGGWRPEFRWGCTHPSVPPGGSG